MRRLALPVFALALLAGAPIGSFLVTTLVTTLVSRSAFAQAKDPEVDKHFATGNDLYNEGKYADALVEYDAAYELSKNYKILYNRGQCLVMLRREPEAIETFERYLKDGGTAIPADRRKQVESDIEKLKGRLGFIVVENAPAGSEVYLDGRLQGTAPLPKPIPAGAGTHDLYVKLPGGSPPYASKVKVLAGTTASERVTVTAPPQTTDMPPPGTPPLVTPPTGPTPPPDYFDKRPPPPRVLPKRPPGGLAAPALVLDLFGGASFQSGTLATADAKTLGAGALGAGFRLSPFWELGAWFGGATARRTVPQSTQNAETGVAIGGEVPFVYSTWGLLARMHAIRGAAYDGWFGIGVGQYREKWQFASFDYSASDLSLQLSVGLDFPLSRAFALGGLARMVTGGGKGTRTCTAGYTSCGGLDGLPNANTTNRTYFEVGLRLVFSLPFGAEEKPAETAAPQSASTAAARF